MKKLSMYRIMRWLFIGTPVLMIIASLFIPPYWHIDKSVWEVAGLFFIMAGLFKFFENVENGKPAKFSTGWTIEFFPHKNKHAHKIYVASSWRNTYYPDVVAAQREIKQKLRTILWIKYGLKDQEVFDKAYSYIEMYY